MIRTFVSDLGWRGVMSAVLLAVPSVAAAQERPAATPPPPAPAAEPPKPLSREELLQQAQDLIRQMEELERTGRVRTSQIVMKPPEVYEREGKELLSAVQEGQRALLDGRLTEAEQRLTRALELSEGLFGQNENWATILNNLALTYHNQGRISEAERAYGRVLEWRDEVPGRDHSDMGVTFQNLGAIYHDQGRYAEAQTVVERALAQQRVKLGIDHKDTLVSQASLGTVLHAQGRYAESEPLLKDALERMTRVLGPDDIFTLATVHNLGVLYRKMDRKAEAEQFLRRALDRRTQTLGLEHPETLNSLDGYGAFLREQKRFAQAEPVLAQAASGYVKTFGQDHPLTLASAANLAFVRVALGKSGDALEAARLSVAGARARRGGAAADRYTQAQRAREEVNERRNYLLLADAAWGAAGRGTGEGLQAEAFLALQDSLGGAANEAIMKMAIRRYADQAGAGLGAVLREREALNERWLGNMQQFAEAQADASAAAPQVRARLRADRDAITARLTAVDGTLSRDFPEFFSLIKPQPLDLAAAQRLIGPDEAILVVVPTDFGTHAMAVTREGAQWARSSWNAERVQAAAERLRWDASGVAQGDPERVRAWQETQRPGAPPSFDRATAFQLYQELVAPVAARLAGKRRLYVAAGGPLAALPFSLLVTEAPKGRDDDAEALRGTAWLADRVALVHIPSVQSLQLLRKAGGGGAGGANRSETFVGFGDPALAGPPAERRGGVALPNAEAVLAAPAAPDVKSVARVSALRAMPQLPGTARELASMRSVFGAEAGRIFTRSAATETAVRNTDLRDARVIVFATHGLTPGELVGAGEEARTASEMFELAEPGLVLTPPETASEQDDGYLAASEVAGLRLNADWVILSACNSATPDDAAEPGLSSLARAFFYAGARNLLASHWPVDDDVGSRITVRTIALERAGTPRAEAFQQAMREIRLEKSRDNAAGSWAHPFFWAPFVLIGDGG
jgi:CHAT domain-containing protein/tetratricopeptide (TPR) repeat protein